MKKLLLGLGTSLLAVIPLAAVVSCSSSVTPTLETEAAKFATSKTTDTKMTSGNAAKSITDASGAPAKLTALKTFATVPTLATGFTFEVKSAAVNSTTNTSVDVKITVTETATSKTKDVTFVVTGLVATLPTLETETAKFKTPVATITPSTTSKAAAASITGGTDAAAKLAALNVLATVPSVASTFSVEVKSAAVNSTTKTSIDVIITIKEIAAPTNTEDVTFIVTGLVDEEAATATLNTEANKLANANSIHESHTAAAAHAAIDIANLTTLDPYYARVEMASGITYVMKSKATSAQTVTIVFTVSSPTAGIPTVEKTVVITFTTS